MTTARPDDFTASPSTEVRIRLLGSLEVRREDATPVTAAQWRTGKTADLLRLLALRGETATPAADLVDRLWPHSGPQRGQASLRTAASQLRRILGPGHVERSLSGLRLRAVTVDVLVFRQRLTALARAVERGDVAGAAELAVQADSLYGGDFRAHDDESDWAREERLILDHAHRALMMDGAVALLDAGMPLRAVDFAARATVADPFSENACRLLMRAYAEAGEVSLALREFNRCRTLLADELGTDPSPETRAVHASLLRGERVAHRSDRRTASAAELGGGSVSLDPDALAHAAASRWLPAVLRGHARTASEAVAWAAELARRSTDVVLQQRLTALSALIAHDLDLPVLQEHCARLAAGRTEAGALDSGWLLMRIATERDDLVAAELAWRLPAGEPGSLPQRLHLLSTAAMYAALGEVDRADRQLCELIVTEQQKPQPLLLPEALARLIMLRTASVPRDVEQLWARLARALGAGPWPPREAYLRLRAQAAMCSARGATAAAAEASASAAELAERNDLAVLAATAHAECAGYTAQALAKCSGRFSSVQLAPMLTRVGA